MPGLRVQNGSDIVMGIGEVGTVTYPITGFIFFVLFRHVAKPHKMSKATKACSVASVLFMNISLIITQLPFDWVSFAEIKDLPLVSIYIGIALVYIGDILLLWACITRVRRWGFCLPLFSDRPLVVSGPYGWLRHPMYLSWLIYTPGLLMVSGNWLFCLALIVRLTFNIFHINAEEDMLELQYGEDYRDYVRTTPGLLPGQCCLEEPPLSHRLMAAPAEPSESDSGSRSANHVDSAGDYRYQPVTINMPHTAANSRADEDPAFERLPPSL